MTRTLTLIASAAVLAFCGSAQADSQDETAAVETATLSVTLTGLDPQTGAVMVGVFSGEEDYKNGGGVAGARIEVDAEEVTVIIENLPLGSYGLKMYHDVNGNGEMDTNPFGMPTEPFAFSNNAKGRFGPASWNDAQFEITAGENTQAIAFGR